MTTLGKLGTAIAFGTLYVATVELYPTSVRGSALGLLLTTGKLGAIAAPQVLTQRWSGLRTNTECCET